MYMLLDRLLSYVVLNSTKASRQKLKVTANQDYTGTTWSCSPALVMTLDP